MLHHYGGLSHHYAWQLVSIKDFSYYRKEESSRNIGKVTLAVATSQVYKDALAPSFNTSFPHSTHNKCEGI
jgi:hypothetical protein